MHHFVLANPEATEALGARLAASIGTGGAVVYLRGDLGAGKTTLVRGLLGAMGHAGAVRSPTYTLMEPYLLDGRDVLHLDLYRIASGDDLETLGLREQLTPTALVLVEWPERAPAALPGADIDIVLRVEGAGRVATVSAGSEPGRRICASL